jgi:D-specific alpha-keto acid dehydrogenase
MAYGEPTRMVAPSPRPALPSDRARPVGITAYGCDPHEAAIFREIAPRLGVVATVTEAAVSATTVELARGNRCISVGHKTAITRDTLGELSSAGVRYLSTRSIGHDHIDVAHAERVGITVGNVDYSPDSVADYTLMLILMVLRGARSVIRRTEVHDYRLDDAPGRELRDLTVGVVGTGRIGTAVLARLRAFGPRVLAHDRRPVPGVEHVSLDELLRLSDVVTLHTPLDAATHHLLDRRGIARMRPGAVVVNTGRGALVDTDALVSALETGRLGGAALDVLEGEEGIFYFDCRGRPPGNRALMRLHRLPNVILSPHAAYYTDRALRDTVENSIVNCLEFESEH